MESIESKIEAFLKANEIKGPELFHALFNIVANNKLVETCATHTRDEIARYMLLSETLAKQVK